MIIMRQITLWKRKKRDASANAQYFEKEMDMWDGV